MEKLNVLVVCNEIDNQIEIKKALKDYNVDILGFIAYNNNTTNEIMGFSPNVMIFVDDGEEGKIYDTMHQSYLQMPKVGIVLIAKKIDNDVLLKAMECGAKQVLSIEEYKSGLNDALIKAHSLETQRQSIVGGRTTYVSKVISFMGGKGGTGKTTLSVNTGVSLAKMGKKVAIIDLDLRFGDVAIMMNLEPKGTIYDLVESKASITIETVTSIMAFHSSGVAVLAAPKSPQYAEYISDENVIEIINVVRPHYDYVIIDLPPGFDDTTIAAIESSNQLKLVANMDIACLKNSKVCVDILEALRQKNKASVIINKTSDGLINKKDFEDLLDMDVKLILPDDKKTALTSLNKGVPFVAGIEKTPISKLIINYASTL